MLRIYSPDYPQMEQRPDGIATLQHRIYFNEGIKGYLQEFTGSLMFTGDTYSHFRTLLFSGACSVLPVILEDYVGNLYEGNIFLNDAKWYPLKRVVECEVVDRGYLSKIDNNAGIKVFLNVPRSKNGDAITATTATGLQYVRPDNTAWVNDRVGVWVFDALSTLVSFMTDNTATVVSDYFSTNDIQPVLIKGVEIRTGGGAAEPENGAWFPEISFDELMEDISKLFCVIFSSVDGTNVIRIEPRSYFNQSTTEINISTPSDDKLTQEADTDSFFAKMMFGGEASEDYNYLPQLRFLGFDSEEYFLGGQCNTKAELDLRPRHVIVDTNILQEVIEAGATSSGMDDYDDDIFMVMHYQSTGAPVLTANPITPTDVYYNEALSNYQTALRWFGQVPFTVYAFFGFGNNEASQWRGDEYLPAYANVGGDFAGLLNFPNTTPPLGYDTNGNMSDIAGTYEIQNTGIFVTDTVTFYTASVSAVYNTHIDIMWYGPASSFGGCFIMKYDALGNFMNIYAIGQSVEFLPDFHRVTGSAMVDAVATDQLCVMFVSSVLTPINFNTSFTSQFWVDDPFTVAQTYDETAAYLMKTTATIPLNDSIWTQIKNNPHGLIKINSSDGVISGHITEAQRNPTTQENTITIRSKLAKAKL